jgi:hypothetical protein
LPVKEPVIVDDAVIAAKLAVPVKVGLALSALDETAVAILSYSVLISVPLTILFVSPDDNASLAAKFVDFTFPSVH